ncbi:DinB family protein [Ilyomonas limi]|uniref:DinB family protein n=1 Tax=Ilyomonas limi TaxID=2575867 RepID=A0A4U3LBW6_9BACT|nr:DinB family protein [Ilyomonas limi]TKK72024.1 DinB family protein [Ilyomonas limi]
MDKKDASTLIEDFKRTTNTWIQALAQYNFVQLCTKPSPGSWSLGQVYMHLLETTGYFIKQVTICSSTNDYATEEATDAAKLMFLHNSFPDKLLSGPPSNAHTPQPANKEQLTNGLMKLTDEFRNVETLISNNLYNGKTKHPGLGYFNAREWLQFTEMHFRHHLRQKKRIDVFLKTDNN